MSRLATDIRSRMHDVGVDGDDEGFAEGLKERIVAREKDFTHYKGYVRDLKSPPVRDSPCRLFLEYTSNYQISIKRWMPFRTL